MIVIPFMADQPTNAKQIEKLGLGKMLEYRQVNSHTLKNKVLSVLSNKSYVVNQLNMQKRMNQAPGNRGGAQRIISYYHRISDEE